MSLRGKITRPIRERVKSIARSEARKVLNDRGCSLASVKQVIENDMMKITPLVDLHYSVHIAEHCNLNCKGCDNFSPLAQKEFLDLQEYERDCKRLSELFQGRLKYAELLGGEPLLNPQIIDFMRVTRECWPKKSGGGYYPHCNKRHIVAHNER